MHVHWQFTVVATVAQTLVVSAGPTHGEQTPSTNSYCSSRKTELGTMQDRLLNAYLAATLDDATYATKADEFKAELLRVEESLGRLQTDEAVDTSLGLQLFDWSQNLADLWLGSNITQQREILDWISLNRVLGDVTLVVAKRKPFDFLAERLIFTVKSG
ncbi:MAG: hypothetical protein ACKOU6_00735 [Planctomycetota bacterium]